MVQEEGGEAVVAEIQHHQVKKVELEAFIEDGYGVEGEVQLLQGLEGLGGEEPVEALAFRPHLVVAADNAVLGQIQLHQLFAGGESVMGDAGDEVLLELQPPEAHQVLKAGLAQLCDLILGEAEGAEVDEALEGGLGKSLDPVAGQVNHLNEWRILEGLK